MSKARRGLPFAGRLFLGMALVLVLALGAAGVAITLLGDRQATRAAQDRVAAASSLVTNAEQQRLRHLRLAAAMLAQDPVFQSYLVEALPVHDRPTLLDQLERHRGELGYDVALLADAAGLVAARTDQPSAQGGSVADRPLIRRGFSEPGAGGAWVENGRLLDAVARPLVAQGISAYLVLASQIADARALEVQRATGADVMFVAGEEAVATSLTPPESARALAALRQGANPLARAAQGGESAVRAQVEFGGARWQALLTPLPDAAGRPAAVVVALASLDRELVAFSSARALLALLAVAALAAALAMALALARGFSRPLRALAAGVDAVRAGKAEAALPRGGAGEVAALGQAVGALLADLGGRRALAEYVQKGLRKLPDEGPTAAPADAPPAGTPGSRPEGRKSTVAAIELRRYLSPRNLADPGESLARLGRDLRKIAAGAAAHNGRVEELAGHRVLVAFAGDGRSERALKAAAEIRAAVAARENAFDDAEAPAIALVSGEALSGPVAWGSGTERVLIAPVVTQAEGLLREAEAGEILLSTAVHGEAAAALARASLVLEAQRGLLQAQAFFRIDGAGAQRLAGPVAGGADGGAAAGALPTTVTPGALVGSRFEIVSTLGGGALGAVYKARDRELGELVALKVLQREAAADRALVESLGRGLERARRIVHPNVLRIFDTGELDGVPFVAMEYVRGVSLRTLLGLAGRLPWGAGLRLARQLLSGLAAGHALEVAHGDLKPDNVLLDPLGELKLADFGQHRPARRRDGGSEVEPWLTAAPHYLAPEQIEGRAADARTDVYACGVLLYEVFTGRLPFSGEKPAEVLRQHLEQAPAAPSLYWPEVPRPFEALLLRCLEKRSEVRPADARALLAELDRLAG